MQFFLELQHHILTTYAERGTGGDQTTEPDAETIPSDDSPPKSRLPVKSIQVLRQQDEEFASLLGTVFDSVIEAFTSLVREMEQVLAQFIVNEMKTKCYSYKHEK